jgi:hypothetical protein
MLRNPPGMGMPGPGSAGAPLPGSGTGLADRARQFGSSIPRPVGGLAGGSRRLGSLFSHLNLTPFHANSTRGSKPFSKKEIMQGHRKMGKCAY